MTSVLQFLQETRALYWQHDPGDATGIRRSVLYARGMWGYFALRKIFAPYRASQNDTNWIVEALCCVHRANCAYDILSRRVNSIDDILWITVNCANDTLWRTARNTSVVLWSTIDIFRAHCTMYFCCTSFLGAEDDEEFVVLYHEATEANGLLKPLRDIRYEGKREPQIVNSCIVTLRRCITWMYTVAIGKAPLTLFIFMARKWFWQS